MAQSCNIKLFYAEQNAIKSALFVQRRILAKSWQRRSVSRRSRSEREVIRKLEHKAKPFLFAEPNPKCLKKKDYDMKSKT